jgi:hypothetical protein
MILPDSKQINLIGFPNNKENNQMEQNELRAEQLSPLTEKREL